MLRAKDMNTKLLDGLEMFLGVGVMFLNSSNSKMAGEAIYIAHKFEVAVGLFLRRAPVRPVRRHQCNRSLTTLS